MTHNFSDIREKWMKWYHEPTREDRSDQTIADFFEQEFQAFLEEKRKAVEVLTIRAVNTSDIDTINKADVAQVLYDEAIKPKLLALLSDNQEGNNT